VEREHVSKNVGLQHKVPTHSKHSNVIATKRSKYGKVNIICQRTTSCCIFLQTNQMLCTLACVCHGLGYFGILWAMSCPRIFWDTFGNIMA